MDVFKYLWIIMTEVFTFFWGGVFSQWHPSTLEFQDVEFNCAEQFMMFMKAAFFKDFQIAKLILASNNPSEQKKLGRKVNNFNEGCWNRYAKDIVYVGSYQKFSMSDFKPKLLETKGTTLVEASPYDKIWGIGLRENDKRALKRETWNGKNWLGEILTDVREDLIFDNKQTKNFDFCSKLIEDWKRYEKTIGCINFNSNNGMHNGDPIR